MRLGRLDCERPSGGNIQIMKNKKDYRVIAGSVLLAAVAAWLVLRDSSGTLEAPTVEASSPAKPPAELVVTTPASPPATAPVPSVAVPIVEADSRAESLATARMYAAHAPLREPTVANPDSAENREILRTMAFKALAGPAPTPPSTQRPAQVPIYSGP